jgi:hypothetical protein
VLTSELDQETPGQVRMNQPKNFTSERPDGAEISLVKEFQERIRRDL